MKKCTIKDVAEQVGVSIGTVSRVLNKASNVDPEIYEKTMHTMHKLNYKPSGRGRKRKFFTANTEESSDNKKDKALAVFFPEINEQWRGNDIFLSYMSGIESVCRNRNYNLVLYMGDKVPGQGSSRKIKERFSGILIKGETKDIEWVRECGNDIPVVGIGMNIPSCPIPQIAFDNIGSAILAVEELYNKGHRRIAFINTMPMHKMFISRSIGYMQACKQMGIYKPEYLIEFPKHPIHKAPDKTPPDCDGCLETLMAMPERPTAVICANDWAAIGFYHACSKKKIKIPDDFSVLGFDDTGDLCHVVVPALSSVAMPFNECGKFATTLLLDRIEARNNFVFDTAILQCLPGKLKLRGSIASV